MQTHLLKRKEREKKEKENLKSLVDKVERHLEIE